MVRHLVWIEQEVAKLAGQVELLHQFVLHHPGGALSCPHTQRVVPDEVAHDLLVRWALCAEQAVYRDVTDDLWKEKIKQILKVVTKILNNQELN